MIGEKIRQERTQHGISMSELARQCNTAVSNVFNIETGASKNPGWYTICKIAKVLQIRLDDLKEEDTE